MTDLQPPKASYIHVAKLMLHQLAEHIMTGEQKLNREQIAGRILAAAELLRFRNPSREGLYPYREALFKFQAQAREYVEGRFSHLTKGGAD